MKVLAIFTLAIIIGTKLFSQNRNSQWMLVSTDKTGSKNFIDTNIQSKSNGVIKLWSKEVNKKLDSITNFQYLPVYLIEIDCNTDKTKLDSSILFDSKNKIIFRSGYNEKWESARPGSARDLMIKKACSILNK